MIVNFLVGPRIRTRIPCDRVAFAVVLARPLAMQGLAIAVGAIRCDFHIVSCGLVDNRGVLRRPRTDLDLALFNFQVPINESAAKHTATPTKHSKRLNRIVLVFMSSPLPCQGSSLT